MEQLQDNDPIISGIYNLAELQGRKDGLFQNIKTTNVQSHDIKNVVDKIPSYLDKCAYLKTISEKFVNRAANSSSHANDIIREINAIKEYINASNIRTCKNGEKIIQELLYSLNRVERASNFILHPETEETSVLLRRGGKLKRTRKNLQRKKHHKIHKKNRKTKNRR